ncbi:MAG: amidohydrolase family protein [Acetobacteraceae bacterium]
MIRIDAHHHVWRLHRGDYGWLTPELPIYRDYTLDDLRPLLGDVTATILVQAAPTEAETAFLLQTARDSCGLVAGVVGWTDLAAPSAPDRIAELATDPRLVGLRPMLQDLADPDWILRRDVLPALRAMVAAGLSFDALVRPRQLDAILTLLHRVPELRVVIDHAGKPDIRAGGFAFWAARIGRLAKQTGAFCKLSGLLTEATPDWTPDDIRRYADHVIDCFGPERVMWGSDWPVLDLVSTYEAWRDLANGMVHASDRDRIFGGTAAVFYYLLPTCRADHREFGSGAR